MRFWNSTRLHPFKGALALLVFVLTATAVKAQNSPYSRYGIGDLVNGGNIVTRGMGGISQAYSDVQTLNFLNPASYSNLQLTTFDFGVESGYRRITDQSKQTFSSGYGTLSYLQLGVPLKQGGGWGLNMGLRPLSKVNYNITRSDSLVSIGTPVRYQYQGSGGLYQAFVGTGYRIKGISFGVNAGYIFGAIQRSAGAQYPTDSTGVGPYPTLYTDKTAMKGFFWNAGVQAHVKLSKKISLELGATGSNQTNLSTSSQTLNQTVYYNTDPTDPSAHNQDTASYVSDQKGTMIYPKSFGIGFLVHNSGNWSLGADYTSSQWSSYRFDGQSDSLQNSWMLHLGGQVVPDITGQSTSYWSLVAYRVGFYTGKDYLRYGGQNLKEYAFSFGLGLPVRNFSHAYTGSNQYSLINTAFEFGRRGNAANNPITENFVKISVGFSLSDIWFIKQKYR